VVKLLIEGKPENARKIFQSIPEGDRDSADWYNLGLAYEAGAVSLEDYEDARRYYIIALEKDPGTKLYAQAIGRIRRYLAETGKLSKQTQK
jgi:tetratricopeptide (TPR) repeat protein